MDKDERIRLRAHEIWERNGRPEGYEDEHWAQAVQEIRGEDGWVDAAADPAPLLPHGGDHRPSGRSAGVEPNEDGGLPGLATPS